MGSYWTQSLASRLNRRRALKLTGAGALGAAFLAACGGGSGNSKSSSTGNGSGLLSQPEDTFKQAKRGGVLKDRIQADVTTFDPFTPNQPLNVVTALTYSSFVSTKPGHLKATDNDIAPDVAESWEWADDGLSVVMKLRPNVKFHNKAPVNGRALDMDDINLSWQRFSQKSTTRTTIANSAAPDAPVLSVTPTDARTVVIKLKEPLPYILGLFTPTSTGSVLIMPKETDGTYKPAGDIIGTEPFYLSNYQPSIDFTFKRHPDFWDKDFALVDEIDKPIISEYSSALAQFKAGHIHNFGIHSGTPQINADDVLPLKRDDPRFQIYQGDLAQAGLVGRRLSFGWLPEGKSPFLDERVRQAVSMGIDRNLYLDTFFNVEKFASEGLPLETRWNTHLLCNAEGWWLNPQGKDFGPNAKYFQHDLTEAKKMLTAAGYPNGFETVSNYVTTNELGSTPKHAEVMNGFLNDLGLKFNVQSLDYVKEYQPQFRDGRGSYEGFGYLSATGAPTGGSAFVALANEYYSKANQPSFVGMSLTGKNDHSGDPQLDALFDKGRLERDTEKLRAVVFDVQRYLAKSMYGVHLPGMATSFLVAWPALRNFQVWRGGRGGYQLWIDDTQAPLKQT